MKPILVLTVGLPRCGKSTWAKAQGSPIVSPDAIRLALHGREFIPLAEPFVWAIARVMVRALFLAGHEHVIVDATNNTKKRRLEWKSDAWILIHETFHDSADVCIERAKADGRLDLIAVIERMAAESDWR